MSRSGARQLGMVAVGQGGWLAGWLLRWVASHWVAKSGYQPPLAVLTERFAPRYSLYPSPVDDRRERARGRRPRERERRSQPVAIPSEGFTLQY